MVQGRSWRNARLIWRGRDHASRVVGPRRLRHRVGRAAGAVGRGPLRANVGQESGRTQKRPERVGAGEARIRLGQLRGGAIGGRLGVFLGVLVFRVVLQARRAVAGGGRRRTALFRSVPPPPRAYDHMKPWNRSDCKAFTTRNAILLPACRHRQRLR